MALSQSALLEVLESLKAADADEVVRSALQVILQELIEAEATSVIGADRHERTDLRTTQRNGHRSRVLTTAAGDVEVAIPKLRTGSFFPSLLERRRRVDQALFAVVMEAYVTGTSVRKVDDLVHALGAGSGISKSEVSRICAELDTEVHAFADRDLSDTPFPYVFLDATYCKARIGGTGRGGTGGKGSRVAAQAVVVATGVSVDGRREVLGFTVGDTEAGAFWTAFLRTLRGPWADRHETGDLRRAHRAQASDRRNHDRRVLATLPGALPAQPARPRPERLPGDGRRRGPDHLRPTRRPVRASPARRDRQHARAAVPQGGDDAA